MFKNLRLFRKIKLGKNLPVNVSKSGLSLSGKALGMTATASKKGITTGANLPIKGLSIRKTNNFKQRVQCDRPYGPQRYNRKQLESLYAEALIEIEQLKQHIKG